MNTGAGRDYSDWAIARAAIASWFAAYILINTTFIAWTSWVAAPYLSLASIGPQLIDVLITPTLMLMLFGPISAVVLVGMFILANWKGDKGSFRSAALVGALTAAFFLSFAIVFALVVSIPAMLGGRFELPLLPALQLAALIGLQLIVGALCGMIGRAAAGAPTLQKESEPEASQS